MWQSLRDTCALIKFYMQWVVADLRSGDKLCLIACLQVISTARTCNVILIVLDCLKPISHKKLIEKELEGFGIRLNKRPPGITFRRKDKGGVSLTTTISEPKLDLDCELTNTPYMSCVLSCLACAGPCAAALWASGMVNLTCIQQTQCFQLLHCICTRSSRTPGLCSP